MAVSTGSKYFGSTSTLSKAFSHLYFALSGEHRPYIEIFLLIVGNRGVEYGNLSNAFASEVRSIPTTKSR